MLSNGFNPILVGLFLSSRGWRWEGSFSPPPWYLVSQEKMHMEGSVARVNKPTFFPINCKRIQWKVSETSSRTLGGLHDSRFRACISGSTTKKIIIFLFVFFPLYCFVCNGVKTDRKKNYVCMSVRLYVCMSVCLKRKKIVSSIFYMAGGWMIIKIALCTTSIIFFC